MSPITRRVPLEAVLLGIKFDGFSARLVLAAQAMAVCDLRAGARGGTTMGVCDSRFSMLFEVVVSNLIFMLTYMDDLSAGAQRSAARDGSESPRCLSFCIYGFAARDLLLEENPHA